MESSGILKKLPLDQDIESKKILKKLASTHRALAELKGSVSKRPPAHTCNPIRVMIKFKIS